MKGRRWFVFGVALLTGACSVGPDFSPPEAPAEAGYGRRAFSNPQGQIFETNSDISAQWWRAFGSRALNRWIDDALARNPSIETAEAALKAAYAAAEAQKGLFLPQIGVAAGASANRTALKDFSPIVNWWSAYYKLYTGQLQLAYAPDVWGANRRAVESLVAQKDAQRWQLEAARITLSANVVTAAVGEAILRGQIKTVRSSIELGEQLVKIARARLERHDIAQADVLLQESALQILQQSLPPLEKQLAQQRDLLMALAGRYPSQEANEPTFDLSSFKLPRKLPVSAPAALVRQRPDVLMAEATMHAQEAQIGVAIANRLPNLNIAGSIGPQTVNPATLFNPSAMAWNIGANAVQNIFDANILLNKQRVAEQQYVAAAAQYRSTVISAFQNVADCMKALQADARTLAAAEAAEKTAQKTLEIVRGQVKLGEASAFAVMTAQQNLLTAEQARVQAQGAQLADTAALFMALGGGWWNAPPPVETTD